MIALAENPLVDAHTFHQPTGGAAWTIQETPICRSMHWTPKEGIYDKQWWWTKENRANPKYQWMGTPDEWPYRTGTCVLTMCR